MQEMFAALGALFTNPLALALMLLGTVVGIVFGALPGMSATLAVAVFLPLTYSLDVFTSVPLLMALYIGGISGGLISAILINIPGTPSSIATTFDGAPMALRGEGGKAIGTGVVFSFLGTIISIIVLVILAPALAKVAINFGPYEYFAVTACSFLLVAGLCGKDMLKGIISALLGILVACIGLAPLDSAARYVFGATQLKAGFSTVPVLVGLFAFPELLRLVEKKNVGFEKVDVPKVKGFGFSWAEFKSQIGNLVRSSLIGIGVGVLPGIGSGVSNLVAYSAAKKASKHPEKFGTGIMDGVVASEASNNAAIGGAMIPLLSLGIPGDAVTAMLLGGFVLQGLTPGPMFFKTNMDVVYCVYAAMAVAAVLMMVLEFFGLRVFVKLLSVPASILLPCVMAVCVLGAFSSTSTMFGVWTLFIFGIVGYVFGELNIPAAPFILGFILGPTCELYLRRGLQMSRGSFAPFFTSPIFDAFFAVAVLFVLWKIFGGLIMKNRKKNAA